MLHRSFDSSNTDKSEANPIQTQANPSGIEPNIDNQNTKLNSINLSELKPSQGFTINGIEERKPSTELFGSVSSGGDINGDGFDDIILSTPDARINNRERVGQSYVIFGKQNLADSGNFDLNQLNGSNGFVIRGIDKNDHAGEYIASAGDVNGDGFDDVVIGAPFADFNDDKFAGEGYIVLGSSQIGSSGSLELSNPDNSILILPENNDNIGSLGTSASDAGDINDDGFDDVIISAPFGQKSRSYVIFGSENFDALDSLKVSELKGSNGFEIDCAKNLISCGTSVDNAGDVNGDDVDDIVIGAADLGVSFVIFGDAEIGSSGSLNLSELDGSNGFEIEAINEGDFLGRSVSNAGDLNNDGFDDLAIGATLAASNGKDYSGESYVIFGDTNLGSSGKLELSALNGSKGFILKGVNPGDFLGHSLASAGDVNGDKIDDLVVVAAGGDLDTDVSNSTFYGYIDGGLGYVIFGNTDLGRFGSLDLSELSSTALKDTASHKGFVLQDYGNYMNIRSVDDTDTSTNNSFSNGGDVNGDKIDDIVIGIPGGSNAADSYVIFGSRQNIVGTSDSRNQTPEHSINASNLFAGQSAIAISLILFFIGLWRIAIYLVESYIKKGLGNAKTPLKTKKKYFSLETIQQVLRLEQ